MLAARFRAASHVRFNTRWGRCEPEADAAVLAAALRALPDGAWPGVESTEGGSKWVNSPLSLAVLRELARLCPQLSSVKGAHVAVADAGWRWGLPLPPSLAALTRLCLWVERAKYNAADPYPSAPAAGDVISALPSLRDLSLVMWPGDVDGAVGRALAGCSGLERLYSEHDCSDELFGFLRATARAGAPLASLTYLEFTSFAGVLLTGADMAAIAAACPALVELSTQSAVCEGDAADWAGVALPHLTHLQLWGSRMRRAPPLRAWAPNVHTLETGAACCAAGFAAPHPALRRLVYQVGDPDLEEPHFTDAWMREAARLTGMTALELRLAGGLDFGRCGVEGGGGPGAEEDGGGDQGGVEGGGGGPGGVEGGGGGGGAQGGGGGGAPLADGGLAAFERAALSHLYLWVSLPQWPGLRSLSLDVSRMELPAARLLGMLCGAPLAATLAELQLKGVALGAAADEARTLLCLPAFPHFETFELRFGRAVAPRP
ncbi:MAG: hypothetical protein J3K34DRAFT_497440 [Monoraphidium minutum]|nr:MAG: hypothetical protein J3K34DRAFT_497440 [Monoraphidium minutum]